ncbi:hypothetical protein QZH41_019237, partial [Actinostola sp. cb2023]
MLSIRQRLKERWNRSENSAADKQDECEVHLRVEEATESLPRATRTSLESRNVEEMPVEHLHFIVDFVGSCTISEAKSVQILSETLKRVKKQQLRTMRVDFTIRDGILKVNSVESNTLLLTAPLYAIALCAQEQLRGFDNCFALNITRKKTHMCHVFEAGSRLEAASVVRSVAVAFKTIGRLLREKHDKEVRQKRSQSISSSDRARTNSEASTITSIEEALKASQRCHALFRERMDRESSTASSSLRRSPRDKRQRSLSKSGTSPSILRHMGVSHLSGRHVEFSPLSPVPSDSSDNEAKASIPVNIVKESLEQKSHDLPSSIVIEAEVYASPASIDTVKDEEVEKKGDEVMALSTVERVASPVRVTTPDHITGIQTKTVDSKASVQLSPTGEYSFLDEDENFKPALQAVLSGNTFALEHYLDEGLSENASDVNQKSLLYHAISNGQTDTANVLLKRGAEVNWEGPEDKTPLHIAASEGNRTATKILLRFGANVRAKDSAFCTPLHLSVGHMQYLEVSHLLVEHGARINDNSLQGIRPVDLEPGGQRSTSECEDSSYMSAGSYGTRDDDPIIEALKSVVLLSGNPECHESLLAYLCLPRASSQLISLARMPSLTAMVAENIAVLIGNLFNLEGPESRKRSVEAGLIKTVLKLVDGAEPIRHFKEIGEKASQSRKNMPCLGSTCLSILHNILDFDNDREYSTALQSIPLEPLLNLLHISYTDSAFDMRATESPPPYHNERGRRRKTSTCSRGSHDDGHNIREMSPLSGGHSVQRNNSGASDVRPEMRRLYHKRSSISSMTSSAEGEHPSSLYSLLWSWLPAWTSISPVCMQSFPRLVATKMLAATTMNLKMQRELFDANVGNMFDTNHDIVCIPRQRFANIGLFIDNHIQMKSSGVMEALTHLLNHIDPRITYHAARGLVYLGHLEVSGIYLFKHITGDEKIDVIFGDTTGSEHLYVKGATVEKIVEIATNNPSILWGGARLPPSSPKGPKTQQDKKPNTRTNGTNNKKASDYQIVDFLLTMYSGYVHPIILMRLLIHSLFLEGRFFEWSQGLREISFAMNCLIKYFDGDPSTGQIEEYAPLPVVHIHLMRLWKTWLDKYPDHFIHNPTIATELSYLFVPMRRAGGPYLPCAESLEALLHGLANHMPRMRKDDSLQENHCHHSILYEQCQKAIVGGGQPCQVDDAIYLSALQLYIEDLSPVESRSRQWFFQGSSPDKLHVSRIKQSLPPSMYKAKNVTKKIKAQRERFINEGLSERNAKHNYVDFCQSIAGYGCRFFKLKECQGTINKKGGHINRLFGINPRKVILLDEKTKSVVGIWQFKDIKRWNTSYDNSRLQVEFTNLAFEFLLDNKSFLYKEITELLFTCTRSNLAALGESDFTPWSKYAEDTEKWGHVAFAAELEHQIPDSGMGPPYDDPISRSRAVSCINAPKTRRGTFPRHSSLVDKFSSSAPFARGNLSVTGNIGPGAIQTPYESGSFVPKMGVAPVLGATGESEGSEPSPTERNLLDPSLSLQSTDRISPSGPPTRHRFLSSDSTRSSIECLSPSYSTTEPLPTPRGAAFPSVNFDSEYFNRMFGLSARGQLLICHCPPDALLPGFDRRNFIAYELLQHPKELARQITIIDHEYFCAVTADDIQKKVAMGTGKKRQVDQEPRLLVERVADRFNQLSTWVVASILTEESPEKRAEMFVNFIETAKQCLEFRNFNAVMAIVAAALGSAPIRRLSRTTEFIPKEVLELHSKFEMLMDPKDNYKRYRTTLRSSPTPAVPYCGIYMKDLTFIAEGNPDFLKGGLVNLSKRRQVYLVVNEIRRFQKNSYNFQE